MRINIITWVMLPFLLISCGEEKKDTLSIAAAANMQFALNEIIEQFTADTGIDCEVVISSSGKLTAQIKEGAPYDLLISADMKYPYELFNSDLALHEPMIYAYGKLVLWSMMDDFPVSMDILQSERVQHIAIANPRTAPYGRATKQLLEGLNIYTQLKEKMVYGESIAQTNQFIITKAAEVGFTAKSVAISLNLKGKGSFVDIPEDGYEPIAQGIVVLKKNGKSTAYANRFKDFLLSSKGKKILEAYGYNPDVSKKAN